MTKTSILEQEEYTQLFIYIYKKGEAKARDITKDMQDYFTNRRNFSMKIKEMQKKGFISIEGYGRHAKYTINKEGVFNFWLNTYVPHPYNSRFFKAIKRKKYTIQKRFYDAITNSLFNNIIIYSEKKAIKISKESYKKLPKNKKNLLTFNTKNQEYYLESKKYDTLINGFEALRDNLILDGLLFYLDGKKVPQ